MITFLLGFTLGTIFGVVGNIFENLELLQEIE